MLTIDLTEDCVRLACEECGARQTLEHRDHARLLKRGEPVECDVCGSWEDARATAAS